MVTLSLCMIVRDEEAVLARCLQSVRAAVDEMILVDTGSLDGTREIAGGFTEKIYDFTWIDDFSAARNYAVSKASGDYWMWLDADDVIPPDQLEALKKLKKNDPDADIKLRDYMCRHFFDIRTFGAVMTTFVKASLNCGQVRGPVQLGFARSIDPIISQEVTITRVAITTEKDAENKNTEMGRKNIVPYGLYRAEGYISANLARKVTGFSEEDLELLWEAIINMFEHDHSAARGKMAVRELIVFKHSKELGDCPAYRLFDAVEVKKKDGVEYPRKYQDYTVQIHDEQIPETVEVKRMA